MIHYLRQSFNHPRMTLHMLVINMTQEKVEADGVRQYSQMFPALSATAVFILVGMNSAIIQRHQPKLFH